MIHPSWCFLFQLLFTSSPFLACSRLTLPWTTADLTSGFSTIVINGRTHFDLGSVMEPRRCCPLRWLCYFHRSNPLDIALAKVSMIAMATTANGTWLAWIWFTLCKAYETMDWIVKDYRTSIHEPSGCSDAWMIATPGVQCGSVDGHRAGLQSPICTNEPVRMYISSNFWKKLLFLFRLNWRTMAEHSCTSTQRSTSEY